MPPPQAPLDALLTATASLRFPAPLPTRLLEVVQLLQAGNPPDIAAAVQEEVSQLLTAGAVQAGARVGIGVGSRGIANLPQIVRATVDAVRAAGCSPFLFPAMGSHGGATAEGQVAVLALRGVTEASAGAPIVATMEVAEIGRIEGGPRLYQGLESLAADHTLLVSRIKPHTDFRGTLESGPSKMAVIGLGKQRGAESMHERGGAYFVRHLSTAAAIYARCTNLLGALCLVENGLEQTAVIRGLPAGALGGDAERALLAEAVAFLPRLPFAEIDVLVVREMGKEISGTGMDTNVLGRLRIPLQPEAFGTLQVPIVAVLDLTESTHGHATGMGLADVTTARLLRKVDWAATYTNAVSAGLVGVQRHALPIVMADDRRALEVAVRACGVPALDARCCFITNTAHLERFWVSPTLESAIAAQPACTIVRELPLEFDAQGAMLQPWSLAPA
jgi:hypothetical protein